MITWLKSLFGSKPKVEEIPQEYEYDSEDVIVKIYTKETIYTVRFESEIEEDVWNDGEYNISSGKDLYYDWRNEIKKHTIINIINQQIPVHLITKIEHEIVPVKIKSKHKIE